MQHRVKPAPDWADCRHCLQRLGEQYGTGSMDKLNLAQIYGNIHTLDALRLRVAHVQALVVNAEGLDTCSFSCLSESEWGDDKETRDTLALLDTSIQSQLGEETDDVPICDHDQDPESKLDPIGQPATIESLDRMLGDRIQDLRERANEMSRFGLRKLKALDLPFDIWHMILGTLQLQVSAKDGAMNWESIWANTGEYWNSRLSAPEASDADPELHAIRNMRLVCRAFDQLASPYMCPILNINLEPSSIENAKGLVKNKLIVAGIQGVQVWLQCYSSRLASNKQLWAKSRLSQIMKAAPLQTLQDEEAARLWWRRTSARGQSTSILDGEAPIDNNTALKGAQHLHDLLSIMSRSPSEQTTYLAQAHSNHMSILQKAVEDGFDAYVKAGTERVEALRSGTLAQSIAACMARVEKPLALALRTGNAGADWPKIGEMLCSHSALREAMSRPQNWTSVHQSGNMVGRLEEARLLYQIPVECHRAGVVLHSFAMGKLITSGVMANMWPDNEAVPDSSSWHCTEDELRASLGNVRQFKVEAMQRKGFLKAMDEESGRYTMPVSRSIDRLYSAAIASPLLEDISMDFKVWGIPSAHSHRASSRRYPLCLAMPATTPWTARLKRLDLNQVTVSHDVLVHLLQGALDNHTEFVRLHDLKVQDAHWTVIWDTLRHSLRGTSRCVVWLERLYYDLPQKQLETRVEQNATRFVTGKINWNPGPSERGSQEAWGW